MTKKLLFLSAIMIFSFSAAFASWDDISPTPAISYPLNSVSFIDIATGYAAGGGGTVLKTADAGETFTAKTIGTTSTNFNDIVFPSSTEGYLLGDAGDIYATTDEGTTYAKMSVPTELASADFRKGSFSGSNRVFAVYSTAESKSYLYFSTDGGLNFSTQEVPGYEILGVTLTEDATWEWGIPSSGGYSILKNGNTVWTGTNSQRVNDLFFVDKDTGFAVGSNGLIIRTTDGNTFSDLLPSGTSQNLNAGYFIAASVGWVVGDKGTILYTLDGGDHFTAYTDVSLDSTGLRDIDIKTTGSGGKVVAHAYVVGEGGKVFKLASPTITSVAPNSRMQGWVGDVTIEGTGFVPGAAVQFGSTEVVTFSTTVESSAKINSVIIIQPQAIVGSRDVTVTNPDITYTNEAGSFFITTNPLVVSLSNARFDGDIIQPGSYTVSPNTEISFEVSSSAADLTKATLNPKILFFQDGYYKAIYNIPRDAITLKATNEANVNFTIPATLPLTPGTAEVELYAEDSLGNVGRGLPVTLEVGSSFAEAGAGKDAATGLLVGNPISGAVIQIRFLPGLAPPENIEVTIFTESGTDVAYKKTFKLSHLKASAPDVDGGYHFNFPFSVEDLAPQYRRACIALGVVTTNGNIIGKFKFPIWMNGAF